MIKEFNINNETLNEILNSSNKFILIINEDTKIIQHNKNFEIYIKDFPYLSDLITYIHIEDFKSKIKEIKTSKKNINFISNFSFNKLDVEDIPSTYSIILSLNNKNEILVIAEEQSALCHEDAKQYLSLVNDYSNKSRELLKTKFILEQKNNELNELNKNLKNKINSTITQLRQNDRILLKQTKDASMGQMIDSIAHQWKNPLGAISILGQQLKLQYLIDQNPTKEEIIEVSDKIKERVDFLIETLDEFRSFFRPKSSLKKVAVNSLINSVEILMKDELIKSETRITKIGLINEKIEIIPNEFKHVLINLITNSIDAFIEKSIKNREIIIDVKKENTNIVLLIKDNAKGVKESIINKIFEANFTTKKEGKGTGIGLYMTKKIINKLKGEISAYNEKDGLCFKIEIPNK